MSGSKFKVGDTVLYIRKNYGRGGNKPVERTIAKVGRKYAYLDHLEHKEWWLEKTAFDLETGRENADSHYADYIYVPEEYHAEQHRKSVLNELRELGVRLSDHGFVDSGKFSTTALERVLATLQEDLS